MFNKNIDKNNLIANLSFIIQQIQGKCSNVSRVFNEKVIYTNNICIYIHTYIYTYII